MHLIRVYPLLKGISKELSYFSSLKADPGDLVSIPMRGKNIPAVVTESADVKETKTDIKRSSFRLQKIEKIRRKNFFSAEFIEAAKHTADFYLTGIGSVIKEFCPATILENPPPCDKTEKKETNKRKAGPLALQSPLNERIKFYKNIARSEFAAGRSVIIVTPTKQRGTEIAEELKKGIENYTIVLNGKLGKKIIKESWEKAEKEKHPLLMVMTPLFLAINRDDTGTIIIEDEASPHYKNKNRPFVDARKFAEKLSENIGCDFYIADDILRVETHERIEKNEIKPASPIAPKSTSGAQENLVDMRLEKTVISGQMSEMLMSAYKNNEHILIFINRRGYELSTVCGDCGNVLSCIKCSTPLVLHKGGVNKFICHKCFLAIDAVERCPVCKGWKLTMLGTGIQKAGEEIKKIFPDFKLFRIDSDAVKTEKQGKKIIDEYMTSPGAVLIATEMLFSFYDGSFDRVGVVTIDGLFNLPDFNINDKIFRMLIKLRSKANKTFIVQTRLPEQPVFSNLFKGDSAGFIKSELASRQAYGYPPFKLLIKIHRDGRDKEKLKKEINDLAKKFSEYEPMVFAPFTPKIKNLYKYYILIKIDPGKWTEKPGHLSGTASGSELKQALSSLPPQWKIEVEPESLL